MLMIDERSFDLTSVAVFNMNKSARERYETPADLRDFMVSMAYHYQYETTSMGTSGFQLTFYKCSGSDHTGCIASVSAFLADGYMREVNTKLAEPWVALD